MNSADKILHTLLGKTPIFHVKRRLCSENYSLRNKSDYQRKYIYISLDFVVSRGGGSGKSFEDGYDMD